MLGSRSLFPVGDYRLWFRFMVIVSVCRWFYHHCCTGCRCLKSTGFHSPVFRPFVVMSHCGFTWESSRSSVLRQHILRANYLEPALTAGAEQGNQKKASLLNITRLKSQMETWNFKSGSFLVSALWSALMSAQQAETEALSLPLLLCVKSEELTHPGSTRLLELKAEHSLLLLKWWCFAAGWITKCMTLVTPCRTAAWAGEDLRLSSGRGVLLYNLDHLMLVPFFLGVSDLRLVSCSGSGLQNPDCLVGCCRARWLPRHFQEVSTVV